MRKKRIMVIGPKGCGKTTLVNSINDYDGPLRRTQDTIYAWCILLLIDQSRTAEVYSHGFARAFHCPVIGVISKCDLMPENREICERQLEKTGVRQPYFAVSVPEGTGVEELKRYLLELKERKGLT